MGNRFRDIEQNLQDAGFPDWANEGERKELVRAVHIAALIEDGTHRVVPVAITPEMAVQLEREIAEPLPPSKVHAANWQPTWRRTLSAAPPIASDKENG